MISSPEDYGLTAEQTLSHAVTTTPPEDFDSFWKKVRDEVMTLPTSWQGSLNESFNEIVMPSLRSIRVVARVGMPGKTPTGVVVTTHGSGCEDGFTDDPEPWAESDQITIRLRVRGYPPSTLDVADCRSDWILHGIESAEAWILRGAVADVVQAYRCARRQFGDDIPISLHGESLGGGLAVLAASQLECLGLPVSRLAIGLPTFGDWAWREGHYCNGSGGQVQTLLDAFRDEPYQQLVRTLALFDTALHAGSIGCPVICKLAHCDDTVPAPSAAAVYNAIASERKWHFETRYGHYDGGLANTRRHVFFEQLQVAFLDPRLEPEQVIRDATMPLKL